MKPWMIVVLVISGLLILLLIAYIIFINYLYNVMFKRMKKEILLTDVDLAKTHYQPVMDMVIQNMNTFMAIPYEEVSILSNDGYRLYGKYYKNGDSDKTILFCHGYHADPFNNINTPGLWLLEAGYNILLITERAHGKSEGKYITFGVKESEDILLWNAYLNESYHPKHITIWGVSMGCASVEMASNRFSSNVDSLVFDCGFTGAYEMVFYSLKRKLHINPEFLVFGLSVLCKARGHFRLEKGKAEASLRENNIPSIFIHGKEDKLVPIEMGRKNYQACSSKKRMLEIDCGHAVSVYFGYEEYKKNVLAFLKENQK